MEVNISQLSISQINNSLYSIAIDSSSTLVLCLSSKKNIANPQLYLTLKNKFPSADIVLCSTAGEIFGSKVYDDSISLINFNFKHTPIKSAIINHNDFANSFDAGIELVNQLPKENLTYILVFSDGSLVNGSELVKGLNKGVDNKILITGGLAGDGTNFESTLVGLNETCAEGNIVAIGFYGEKIIVTHGSKGGWESFGPEREVTKSHDNVLEEIDNKLALESYKKYLGTYAEGLPSTALLFPLSVKLPDSCNSITRTILSIDEDKNTMTFAGDIPVGSKVRLMKSDVDKLTSAASIAIKQSLLKNHIPNFSLLISCVGRKIVLNNRVDEEIEAIIQQLSNKTNIAGFYSYGEISPFNEGGNCQLHNQTMTITSFYELP